MLVELRPRGVAVIESGLASVWLAKDRYLVRATFSAAPHLKEAPAQAHVGVLFDSSKSNHSAEAGFATVRAYLGHMPGATIDFLTFDREVRWPLGLKLPVARALAKLAAFEIDLRNGSRLDDALRRADAILQASPASVRRVVMVTDMLARTELTAELLGKLEWKSGAVLHLATVAEGPAALNRDDSSKWSTLPRRTGGLFWQGSTAALTDNAARTVYKGWARPKRIDKLVVEGLDASFDAPASLDEGEALTHFAVVETPTPRAVVSGELWSAPFRASVVSDSASGKLAAALTFGSDFWSTLSEPEQRRLAMLGGVVSPVTSYLAIEPGVRPSIEGLNRENEPRGFGDGVGRTASFYGQSCVTCHAARAAVDKRAWLDRQVLEAMRACPSSARELRVTFESTLDEVVDVGEVVFSPKRDARAEACVREGLWSLDLPESAFDAKFEAHSVTVRR